MIIRIRNQIGFILTIVAQGMMLSSCGGKYTVAEITNEPRGQSLNGVPFRIKEFYKPELYRLDRSTGKYLLLDSPGLTEGDKTSRYVTLANPDRLFLLKFKGDALADISPAFGLNQDGTLSSASVTYADKSLETLSTLATEAEEYETARKSAKPTSPTGDVLKNYQAALHNAENAVIAFQSLGKDAPPETLRIARQAMEKAMLVANLAAMEAKRSLPYPDFKL